MSRQAAGEMAPDAIVCAHAIHIVELNACAKWQQLKRSFGLIHLAGAFADEQKKVPDGVASGQTTAGTQDAKEAEAKDFASAHATAWSTPMDAAQRIGENMAEDDKARDQPTALTQARMRARVVYWEISTARVTEWGQ